MKNEVKEGRDVVKVPNWGMGFDIIVPLLQKSA